VAFLPQHATPPPTETAAAAWRRADSQTSAAAAWRGGAHL